ncbi:MAG TPA: MBL fold metallo-hydrolase [Terriglobales bacterium]|nr:MBL fold metallo-hydrolase [Terriglobales bacterium]
MLKHAVVEIGLAVSSLLAQGQLPPQSAQPQSAQPQAPPFTVKQVGNGVYAAISSHAGGNSGFIIGDNGVLVVDTFINQAPARDLLAEIRKLTNLPVKYVVNTHYHLDHVAGNAVFTETGAAVIAHRNERAWVRTENLKFFQQNGATPTDEQRAQVAALVEPQIAYDHVLEVNLGSRLARVVYLPGHTGGDSVVFVPDANVVFAGDLAWNQRIPNLIDATTSDWIETLNRMLAAHPAARFVPGHGDLATAQDIQTFRDYLAALRASIQKKQAAGQSGEGLTQAVLSDLKPKYGSWPGFDRLGPLNVQQTTAELAGTKKVPKAD